MENSFICVLQLHFSTENNLCHLLVTIREIFFFNKKKTITKAAILAIDFTLVHTHIAAYSHTLQTYTNTAKIIYKVECSPVNKQFNSPTPNNH